mmetsp:Transcript_33992/g.80021  ORF Transcript_33992/g.80021 Transcript_33992/m.80021 type:complete len:262 (-) Transcript_33992:131-916(-)
MSASSFSSAAEEDVAPGSESMDRGLVTDAMSNTLESCETMEIRHYRRGWIQEFFCCITRSDFKFFNEGKKVATSKEDFAFVCRCCFGPCHPFDMTIKDKETDTQFLEINRPSRCCMGTTKCCCRQEATIFSGDEHLGDIQETCWCCVPKFKVYDQDENELYIIRPPTCCGNMCIDCMPDEKCPCPHGCCMIPCDVYTIQNGAEGFKPIGRMAKIPKKTFKETFNEINYYKVDFPQDATTNEKGLLLGSSLLINALYFEHSE